MTENKRFEMIITGADGSFHYFDKNTGEKITSTLELENKLNTLHEERNYFERKKEEFLSKWSIANTENIQLRQENEQLKQELFESEKEYLIETYSDNSVRKNDKIHSLKKEFKERFGRDFE